MSPAHAKPRSVCQRARDDCRCTGSVGVLRFALGEVRTSLVEAHPVMEREEADGVPFIVIGTT